MPVPNQGFAGVFLILLEFHERRNTSEQGPYGPAVSAYPPAIPLQSKKCIFRT